MDILYSGEEDKNKENSNSDNNLPKVTFYETNNNDINTNRIQSGDTDYKLLPTRLSELNENNKYLGHDFCYNTDKKFFNIFSKGFVNFNKEELKFH